MANETRETVSLKARLIAELENALGYWEYVRDNPESPNAIGDAIENIARLSPLLADTRKATIA